MDEKDCSQSVLRNFQQCYKMCCKTENIIPLKCLSLKNNGHTLDFCVDRIKYNDWAPIFIAISDDLSLHCIIIRCRHNVKTVMENIDSERIAKVYTRGPIILSKFMLNNLVDALAQCVSQSLLLNMIQLEGIPLYPPYIDSIADSFSLSHSLKHISLSGCLIGDAGCQKLCSALRNATNVVTINLTGCNITLHGAIYVAELIKYLKIFRYSENWKQTLRYQNPDLDSMAGLRRLTLSENPEFGDAGLLSIIEILMDDLWIKGIDMQQCGLTEAIVKNCLHLLEYNSSIRILDLRYNPQISLKSIGSIAIALRKNENNLLFDQNIPITSHPALMKMKEKNKQTTHKEKLTLQTNYSSTNIDKSTENKVNSEINSLKEQLSQEIAHRQHLEELNDRLLQQVKELKTQQIKYWKEAEENHSNNFVKRCQPQRIINNIKTNKHLCSKSSNTKIVTCVHDSRNNNICENKHIDSGHFADTDSTGESNCDIHFKSDFDTKELKHKICTGADILEKLLEQRYNSMNENKNSPSTDTDESSYRYSCSSSSGSDSTIRFGVTK